MRQRESLREQAAEEGGAGGGGGAAAPGETQMQRTKGRKGRKEEIPPPKTDHFVKMLRPVQSHEVSRLSMVPGVLRVMISKGEVNKKNSGEPPAPGIHHCIVLQWYPHPHEA